MHARQLFHWLLPRIGCSHGGCGSEILTSPSSAIGRWGQRLALVLVGGLAGAFVMAVDADGLPTRVTITGKSAVEGPCARAHYIAFRDARGRGYEGQLVTEDTWERLRVGDVLPARARLDGSLRSVSLGGARS